MITIGERSAGMSACEATREPVMYAATGSVSISPIITFQNVLIVHSLSVKCGTGLRPR